MRTWTLHSSVLVIAILAALPGCGDDGAPFEGVVLGLTDRYVTEGGDITVSRDMSEYESVEAQVIRERHGAARREGDVPHAGDASRR
jgi:hypothetical protein